MMENITLNVSYYMADEDENKKQTTLSISAQATIAEFLDVFFQQTGEKRTYKYWTWTDDNKRQEVEIPYMCEINGIIVFEENENDTLNDWNIGNDSTVAIVIGAFVAD